jgi:hypothetical protein
MPACPFLLGKAMACALPGPGALAITCRHFFGSAACDWMGCVATLAPPGGNSVGANLFSRKTQNPPHPYALHSS